MAEECLIVLNNTVLRENTKLFNTVYRYISVIICNAYCDIYDYTRATEWGEKNLEATVQLFGEFSDKVGSVAMTLTVLYRRQLKYEKAN